MTDDATPTHRRRAWAWAVGCVAIAVLAATWSVCRISLTPPGLTPRALEMATAHTSMLVDTSTPSLVDPTRDTYSFKDLMDRAVLLGSVMSNGPLHAEVARTAGVPDHALRVEAPLTREKPRVPIESGSPPRTSDILKSNDQYRLALEVDPTVPVLDIYAQAPTAIQAEQLANAAFVASRGYVTQLEAAERTPPEMRVTLMQLGPAKGAVINGGVRWQIAAVIFVLALALSAAAVMAAGRIRRGWRAAVVIELITRS